MDCLSLVTRCPGLILSIRIEGYLPLIKNQPHHVRPDPLNLAINVAAAMNGQGELTIALEEDARGFGAGIGQQTSFVSFARGPSPSTVRRRLCRWRSGGVLDEASPLSRMLEIGIAVAGAIQNE
jgi:hypothetical protein